MHLSMQLLQQDHFLELHYTCLLYTSMEQMTPEERKKLYPLLGEEYIAEILSYTEDAAEYLQEDVYKRQGSRLLLLDEDTSATNFMVRDAFMQKVVSPDKEPITPFLSRARDLYEKAGISTILVAGSSGAFFHIADTVIQMDQYEPVDITEKAKELCGQFPIAQETAKPFVLPDSHRVMEKDRRCV